MSQSCAMHGGPTLRPLAEPLRLAAIELTDLAALGDQLQRAIGRLTASQGAPDPAFLTEAQAADLLSQRLEGIAAFLRVIAASAPEDVTTDVHAAVMSLTLAEQARRLSGPHPVTAHADPAMSGELQLFKDQACRRAARERINLSTAEVLIIGADVDGVEILVQMFAGFGVHTPRRCASGAEAMTVVGERDLNLVVVDTALADTDGYDFIKWLRRCGSPNAWVPVILVTGHTTPSEIFRGRDAGASFVVRKPVPPLVMMQRIFWLLSDPRSFVTSPGYYGPDRRVRSVGPPVGIKGRRHDDLSVEVGEAKTPNLEQDEIDALFQPKAVAR